MKQLFVIFGSLFLLVSLTFVSPVLAGGQLVSFYADGDGWVNGDMYGRVMRVYLHPEFTCKGAEITFKFVDPKEGDLITTAGTGSTVVMQEDRNPSCATYAKMQSKVYGERQVTVEVNSGGVVWHSPPVIKVHFDGKYHSDNQTNNESYRSSIEDPYLNSFYDRIYNRKSTSDSPSAPSANIDVRLLEQEFVEPYSRQVTVKWSAFDGYSGTFTVYVTPVTNKRNLPEGKNSWEEKFNGSKGPSATFNLRADQDYYIKINGCMDKWGTCADSNILLLPKLQNPTIVPSSTGDSKNVEELNKKVENLQNQLDQSKKTQNVLEQRINDLINFIKRLFPFFK